MSAHSDSNRPQRPRFYGVATYRDELGRFSLRHPFDWHRFDLDGREGTLFSPQNADPTTYVAVWVDRAGASVLADDLPDLRAGVDDGLAQLPGYTIESGDERTYGNLVRIERIYEFDEPISASHNDPGNAADATPSASTARRKRRAWVLYIDTWQVCLTYQGESPTEYDYWLPMGNYAFATFEIPEALWSATDPQTTSNPSS